MKGPDRVAKNLVDASLELHRRRCWTGVPADAPFLMRIPVEEEPVACILIGQDGDELGLIAMKGPDALAKVVRTFFRGETGSDDADRHTFSSVSFERFGKIPPKWRVVLQAAGFQTRSERIAPFVFTKPAHRGWRAVNRGEMSVLAWCLRGIFAAEDRGELRPATYAPGRRVLEIAVKGKPRKPEVATRQVRPPREDEVVGAAPALIPADLGDLPRRTSRWIAGLVRMPGHVQGDDRTLHAVLVLEDPSERIVASNVVQGGDMTAAVSALVDALREHGLPRELAFTSETLHECVGPGLAALGVPTDLDPEEPLWWGVASDLIAHFTDDEPLPDEPRSVEDWKAVEPRFVRHFARDLLDRGLLTPRAAKRYFGSEEEAIHAQEECAELSATPAFIDWFMADYRATRRSRTYVEKELERRSLGPVERALLESRRDAILSFFRVVSSEPGASLEVEDVLCGRRFTVHDRKLSTAGLEGWFLPLRLFPTGEWYFAGVAGPPFGVHRIDAVLARLEDAGVNLEPDGLRAEAHLLGRTWTWFLERRESTVEIQNTDGDPLEWHTAEFRVADPAALVAALESRDDVIIDEPGAEWSWVRPGGPSGIGETTTLCGLQLFGDSLVAEVNSARRLERARAWLETLPTVTFVDARRSDLDGPEDGPLDDRLPGPPPEPLSPELVAELEGFWEERVMRWIDEPVPALGELTPRAACATEQGRRRVARLIRTMPSMRIPGGELPVPRERILRELGLA